MTENEENEKPPIIIDNGTGFCKAGFGEEEGPRIIESSIVGYPKNDESMFGSDGKEFFVGGYAESRKGILKFNYPISRGINFDWDDLRKIYSCIFTSLCVDLVDHNIMITEPIMNPKRNREKLAQIMFEDFNASGLYFEKQPILSLYHNGKFTGFAIDSGEGLTQFTPIWEGYSLSQGFKKLDLGGEDVTNYMLNSLNDIGANFSTNDDNNEKKIVEAIKEKACYVALNFTEELKSCKPFNYELPDGNEIIVENQRIKCIELLFQPSNIEKKGDGLPKICYDLIQKCNINVKKDLYNNICLCGGNTMFNGFAERFKKEIKDLVPKSMKEEIKVIASNERKFSTWIGGSVLSTLSSFKSKWITKKDYEENGSKIIK